MIFHQDCICHRYYKYIRYKGYGLYTLRMLSDGVYCRPYLHLPFSHLITLVKAEGWERVPEMSKTQTPYHQMHKWQSDFYVHHHNLLIDFTIEYSDSRPMCFNKQITEFIDLLNLMIYLSVTAQVQAQTVSCSLGALITWLDQDAPG